MSQKQPLEELEDQYRLIRDRVRSVVGGHANGMYLHGKPGISKTYQVTTFLSSQGVPYTHVLGHITGTSLFDEIAGNPAGIIVLDDVSELFKRADKGVQILLAALGSPSDGSRTRKVTYATARSRQIVHFTGGIIAISNLAIAEHRNGVLQALADRVHVQKFDPTPEQVEAAIYKIASECPSGVAAGDAITVAEFLVEECKRQGTRLTIRLFVEKALQDFRMWTAEDCENHWKDLVRASVAGELVPQQHPVRDMTRKDQAEAHRRIALAICQQYSDPKERCAAWTQMTSRQKSAFYARCDELKVLGLLTDGRSHSGYLA
jgi:hypothetical protein